MPSAENEKGFYDFGVWLLPVQDVPFQPLTGDVAGTGKRKQPGDALPP